MFEPLTATRSEMFSYVLNLSPHYHIYMVKYFFTSRDDQFQNLGEITILYWHNKVFPLSFCWWLKNIACLSSLLH